MSIKTLNNPSERLNEQTIEFVNNSGGTLYDGDVVIKDISGITTKVAASTWDAPEQVVTSTSLVDKLILGVVRCPSSAGILNGERGTAIVRGYHPAVNMVANNTGSAGDTISTSTSAGKAKVISAGTTVVPGSRLGHALKAKTTALTTIPVFVDVK